MKGVGLFLLGFEVFGLGFRIADVDFLLGAGGVRGSRLVTSGPSTDL